MSDHNQPESIEERNLRMLISSTLAPSAPPLSSGLPAQLANRACGKAPERMDLPLAAAGCSAVGLLFVTAFILLPAGRTDLRWWAVVVPAVNLLLSPFAAYVVIMNIRREAIDAKT